MIAWCLQLGALCAFLLWLRVDAKPQPESADETLEAAMRRVARERRSR